MSTGRRRSALGSGRTHDGEAMSLPPTMAQVLDSSHRHARLGALRPTDDAQRDKPRMSTVACARGEDVSELTPGVVDAAILPASATWGSSRHALYVGDALVDVAGFAGMPVVWFNHQQHFLEVRSAPSPSCLLLPHDQEKVTNSCRSLPSRARKKRHSAERRRSAVRVPQGFSTPGDGVPFRVDQHCRGVRHRKS